ncbi:MAG: methyltransferase, partial [Micrococcales bacterium]
PQTSAVRELGRLVRERTDLISTMLNIGDGLLLATKRAP